MGKQLTPKQLLFVQFYCETGNATLAAIKAGYAEKNARTTGPRMLHNDAVKADIDKKQAEINEKLQSRTLITKERISEELAKIAFANMEDYGHWDRMGLRLYDSKTLDSNQLAAVKKISWTMTGPKIELYDKKSALMDLAELHGFVIKKVENTGKDGEPLTIIPKEIAEDIFKQVFNGPKKEFK